MAGGVAQAVDSEFKPQYCKKKKKKKIRPMSKTPSGDPGESNNKQPRSEW
jgi:hypothetical protein